MALTLTAENFEKEVLKAKKPVLVDFWAPWCGPCQMLGPIIDELAEEMGDAVKIGKLNVDDGAAVASEFGIMSIPTLILFQDGAAVSQVSGLQTKAKLQDLLKKVIQA
ncbi:MAG: thioredoxin [Candidatus Paceibacterota bacterium]